MKTVDKPYIEEVIKATYITEDNLEVITNLFQAANYPTSMAKIGWWMVSLTVRVDSTIRTRTTCAD